jgi:hypothetical protein
MFFNGRAQGRLGGLYSYASQHSSIPARLFELLPEACDGILCKIIGRTGDAAQAEVVPPIIGACPKEMGRDCRCLFCFLVFITLFFKVFNNCLFFSIRAALKLPG